MKTFEYKYPKHYKPLPENWVVLCDESHCWGWNKKTDQELPIHWSQYVARRWVFETAKEQEKK